MVSLAAIPNRTHICKCGFFIMSNGAGKGILQLPDFDIEPQKQKERKYI